MSYIVGEVYIVRVHDWHAKRDQQKFYNVRSECIGQNNIGSVGCFSDANGNVFHSSSPLNTLEGETLADKKDVLSIYPLHYGVWRKVEPPKQLQKI